MADNEEVIGGVAIAVTGDFSDLDAAFETAVAKAVAEGATLAEAIQSAMVVPDASGIADAFGQVGAAATNAATQLGLFDDVAHVDYSDATGQLNLFATELEPIGAAANTAAAGLGALGDDVTAVGGAAGGAAAPVDQFAESAEHAGEAAHEAAGGLGGMAEQLLAFGEALAVTEALKEFGEEALHAYDSMQKATNSLTALTGSAETAKEVIEGIEAIAVKQPFSFPELAGAAQKMAAFGIEAEKIPELLAAAGNASRGTGNSFDGIASALERVSISGAVTARQLYQLGISWGDLANSAGKSIEATQALVKKGGQDAAADLDLLLKAVEDKFSKFATVPLTIGEQWVVLQNQMHTVFADIGEALAPTIQRIVDIIQTDLIPAVKTATEWFKSLPEPVRDAAVAFGLAVAALAPIAVALAGAALAITGITEAVEIAGVAFEALAGGLGVASLALSEILIPLAAIGIAIAAIHFSGLDTEAYEFASNLKGDFEGIADLFSGLTQSAGSFFVSLASGVESALRPFADGIANAWKVLSDGVGSAIHPATEAVESFWAALTSTVAETASAAFGKVQEGLDLIAQKAQPATDALGRVKEVLGDTTAKQEAFFAGVSAGAPQLDSLARGLAALSNALDFLGGHYQTLTDAMTKGNPIMKENADRMHDAGQAAMEAAGLFDKHTESTNRLTAATSTATEKTILLQKATHDFVDIAALAAAGALNFQSSVQKAWDQVGLLAVSVERINEQIAVSTARFNAGTMSAEQYHKVLSEGAKILSEYNKALDLVNKTAQVKATADAANAKFANDAAIAAMDEANALKALGLLLPAIAPVMSDLNRAMSDFGIGAGKAKTAVENLKTPIEFLVIDLGTLTAAAQKSGDWTPVINALDAFDKRIQTLSRTDLPEAARQMEVWIQGMIDSHVPTELVQGQLDKLSTIIQKMSKEGLPEAAAAWQTYLGLLQKVPQTIGDILLKQELEAQAAIKTAEANGTGADQWILKLEAVKLKQESLKLSTEGLATIYVGLINDVLKGFDNMSKSIADNIVDGKKWGDVWNSLLTSFAKTILETVIQGALAPLKKELIDLIGKLLPDVSKGFGLTADGAKALSDAAKDAAASAEKMSASADKVAKALGDGSKSGGGLAGSVSNLTDTINLITGIISAGAAVASTVLLSHISSDTGHIEVNTRGSLAEALNLRADLWSQFNQNFTRFGEIKNDLDALVAAASKTGSASAPGDLKGDLDIIATDANLLVVGIQNIANTLLAMAGADNLMVLGLQNINSTTYALHDDLGVVIGKLDTIISSILYGGRTNDQSLSALARATQEGSNQVEGAVRQASALQLGGSAADREGRAREAALAEAAAQQALTLARQQYAAATSIAAQVAALKAQVAADNQLAMLAERQGNTTLAASYTSDANRIQQDIVALIPQIGTVVSSVNNVAGTTAAGASAVSIAATNAGVLVAAAVGNAAAYIASSVSAAVAAAASFAPTGGGQYQFAPYGTSTYQQGSESQNPGNSNSPGGNTGTSGSSGPGGYTSTGQRTSTIPPPVNPPKYDPMYNADGTPFTGNAGARTPPPFDPNNPNTWNQSTSYDEGGYVPHDMMAKVHAGEWVLPPDVTGMLRQMASNPTGDFGLMNPSGGGGSAGNQTNIFHVYAPSPREAAQQIATYMKTQSRKMAILSS